MLVYLKCELKKKRKARTHIYLEPGISWDRT